MQIFQKNVSNHLVNSAKVPTFALANEKCRKSTSYWPHRGVEQLVARQAHNLEVVRSSRAPATKLIDTHESEMKRSSIRTSFFIQANPLCRNGGMVDTRDLKSLGHCARAGSSPAFGTKHKKDKSNPRSVRGLLLCFLSRCSPTQGWSVASKPNLCRILGRGFKQINYGEFKN